MFDLIIVLDPALLSDWHFNTVVYYTPEDLHAKSHYC